MGPPHPRGMDVQHTGLLSEDTSGCFRGGEVKSRKGEEVEGRIRNSVSLSEKNSFNHQCLISGR